jgi:hypothetical protein
MSNPKKEPYIHSSYQVSGHFAKRFQRGRLKHEKFIEVDRRRTPNDGKSSRCLWQGEQKRFYSSNKGLTC